jgi:hypothetical protein
VGAAILLGMRRLLVLGLVACGPSAGPRDVPVLTVPPQPRALAVAASVGNDAKGVASAPRLPDLPTCATSPRDPRVRAAPSAIESLVAEHAALSRTLAVAREGTAEEARTALRLGDVEIELSRSDPARASLAGDAAVHYGVARRLGKGAFFEAATYRLALGAECRGELASARTLAFEIVSHAPSSSWAPHAFLLFGELFFAEGAKDPSKLELARMAYLEVTKRRGDADITAFANERLRALPTKPEPGPDDP